MKLKKADFCVWNESIFLLHRLNFDANFDFYLNRTNFELEKPENLEFELRLSVLFVWSLKAHNLTTAYTNVAIAEWLRRSISNLQVPGSNSGQFNSIIQFLILKCISNMCPASLQWEIQKSGCNYLEKVEKIFSSSFDPEVVLQVIYFITRRKHGMCYDVTSGIIPCDIPCSFRVKITCTCIKLGISHGISSVFIPWNLRRWVEVAAVVLGVFVCL